MLGVTEDTIPSDARSFSKRKRATWPMLNDAGGAVAKEYGVRPIPQTMFVDRDGTLTVRVNAPLTLLSKGELDTELAKILAPRPRRRPRRLLRGEVPRSRRGSGQARFGGRRGTVEQSSGRVHTNGETPPEVPISRSSE